MASCERAESVLQCLMAYETRPDVHLTGARVRRWCLFVCSIVNDAIWCLYCVFLVLNIPDTLQLKVTLAHFGKKCCVSAFLRF